MSYLAAANVKLHVSDLYSLTVCYLRTDLSPLPASQRHLSKSRYLSIHRCSRLPSHLMLRMTRKRGRPGAQHAQPSVENDTTLDDEEFQPLLNVAGERLQLREAGNHIEWFATPTKENRILRHQSLRVCYQPKTAITSIGLGDQ